METHRWYMLNKMGMATLCSDKDGAEQEAADAQRFWPHMGPHRAVQLVEAADAPQDSFDHGPQATSIDEAARDVGKWLNERPNRPIDLRHVAMLCAHATAAHQQEAQEPVAWMTQEGDRVTTAKTMNAARRDGGAMLTSLRSYSVALVRAAAPQPSPTAQGDALDAARYRYLRDGDWRENDKLESIILLQLNSLWDAAIDDARAAQEGKK